MDDQQSPPPDESQLPVPPLEPLKPLTGEPVSTEPASPSQGGPASPGVSQGGPVPESGGFVGSSPPTMDLGPAPSEPVAAPDLAPPIGETPLSPEPPPQAGVAPINPPLIPEESPPPAIAQAPVTPETHPAEAQVTVSVPVAGEETLVIPPAGAANPFIPAQTPGQKAAPKSGGSLPRRILMIVVLLLVVGGLAVGGKFALGLFNASQEVKLTYWGLWESDATVQAVINDFQTANPKIKVTYVKQSPRQYRERLQAAIARGEGPDIFQFHNTWVPMLRSELSIVPPKIMTTAEFASSFYPVASADLVGGENIYGMPIMFDGLALYYNEDLFASAGVTPPTTWPEVLDLVPKLTVMSASVIQKSAIALGTTGNVENFSDIIGLMLMQNGAKPANPTGKEAEDTLTFYRKFANPADPVYTWNETMDNSIYAFAIGRVAMILAPSWRAFDIKQISPNLRFKIVPVPQLPGNTVNWASYWVDGVSQKSKYPTQAWTFVKYTTGREAVTKLYSEAAKIRLFGEPYARVDLASALQDDPYVGAYIKEAPTAKSFPLASRTFDNGINDKMIKYMEDAVNAVGQGSAPSDALQVAASGFQQVLSSYGLTSSAPVPR